MNAEPNIKRSRNLITWSGIYLAASWLVVVADFLNPNADTFVASDLLLLFIIPAGITTFIINFRWVRSLIITAKQIKPEGIGYRQGWAFWSWVTPFASLFIPRRLITRSYETFAGITARPIILVTNLWWGFFIASGIMDNLSIRAGLNTPDLVPFLDLLSAVFLSIAYPHWKTIVETVTSAQADAEEKLNSSEESTSPQG